jgi:hypothetical protein
MIIRKPFAFLIVLVIILAYILKEDLLSAGNALKNYII